MTLDAEKVKAALPAYDVGGELGRGGWGVVLEARHRRLGREVAVKQLPRAFAADPSVRARFVAEARVLASLDHPHIVPVYDYVEFDGLCLLVMEKLPGGTVWDRFVGEGLTMESSCAIVLATSAALHAAHQSGVLHRDVKPENLMFSAAGVLKVTDFGIAKVVGGSRTMATRAGEILGTPAYMAPEHARGEPLGPPADVYAAGVLLYELLSGCLPFSDEGDALAVLYRHVHEEPVPLPDAAPAVPIPIATAVMKALAPQVDDRYQTAEAFGVAVADAAGAAWGPRWASDRTDISVMGSPSIVSAIERSGSYSRPRAGHAPLTVPLPAVTPQPAPTPPTAAVRPTGTDAARHAERHPPESAELVSLHEVPAADGRALPRTRRFRKGTVALVAGLVLLAGSVLAVVLVNDRGTSRKPARFAAPPSTALTDVIFRDDFSDTASGWTQADKEDYRTGYVSGKFLVLMRKPDLRVTSDLELEGPAYRPDLLALGDVAIEVDAENIVPVHTFFGVLCRRDENGGFYFAQVDSDGRARVEKVDASGRVTLADEPLDTASATGVRHLRFECLSHSDQAVVLRFFVDGKLAAEATDIQPIAAGTAGVVVSSADKAGSQVLFDNFVVRRLGQ